MDFTDTEQAIIEEMVRTRHADGDRPAWTQSHRWTAMKKEARRRIATLPPPQSPTGDGPTYHAQRRVTIDGEGDFAIHESDGDVPICHLGDWFRAENVPRRQLGPGKVDCGHCVGANTH
jgi:hypothetical protein